MNMTRHPRFKQKELFSLSLDEAKAVLESCQATRERALIHLYLGHSLRLEEGVRMNIGDIENGQMLVRGKMRIEYMPLLPESREILLELAGGRGPYEPPSAQQASPQTGIKCLRPSWRGPGVIEGRPVDSRIATHTIRKSFYTLAHHAGCDGRVIERLLRHMKRDMTSLYVGMPMNSLIKYMERYLPIMLIKGHSQERVAESIT